MRSALGTRMRLAPARAAMGIDRLFMTMTKDGKVRLFLGSKAEKEKRRLARQVDRTIQRALAGELGEAERSELEAMADLAAVLAKPSG
jgi:hypothetical protein